MRHFDVLCCPKLTFYLAKLTQAKDDCLRQNFPHQQKVIMELYQFEFQLHHHLFLNLDEQPSHNLVFRVIRVMEFKSQLLKKNINCSNLCLFLTEEIYSHGEPQRKRELRSAVGLFKLLASYCGSVSVLTIWYFQPSGNEGLQSPRNLPSP